MNSIQTGMGVLFAGGLGSLIRYGANLGFGVWATGVVNAVGCLLMGVLYSMSDRGMLATSLAASLATALMTGLLGGLTTFSALGLELYRLAKDGAWGLAAIYGLGHLIIGVGLVALGANLGSLFPRN